MNAGVLGQPQLGTDQKGLSTALQPNWQQMLDCCRAPALLRDSMGCPASIPARHKEESAGNLLASPPVLSGFLTATAVTNTANLGFGGVEEHASLGRSEIVACPCFETHPTTTTPN